MTDLTIETCLETAIRNVQNNWSDEKRAKAAQDSLYCLCCGIVAGLKAHKHSTIDATEDI